MPGVEKAMGPAEALSTAGTTTIQKIKKLKSSDMVTDLVSTKSSSRPVDGSGKRKKIKKQEPVAEDIGSGDIAAVAIDVVESDKK
jgi:hypothetical protein